LLRRELRRNTSEKARQETDVSGLAKRLQEFVENADGFLK
jgi:hypothetical protein